MVEISSNDGITYQQYSRDGSGNINVELSNNDIELTGRITPEALAALGYIPEPAWLPVSGEPSKKFQQIVIADKNDKITRATIYPGDTIGDTFTTAGAVLWYPLPAIPGKGEE